MPWTARLRQLHRWLSLAFTATVALNFAALAWGEPPTWIYFLPLPPLFLLMATGLVLYALPHVARWRARGRGRPQASA